MRATGSPPRYATEAELCADFISEVRESGRWECYPETAGWDILLVRKSDGFQIGVEAKLRLNAKVVAQALEAWTYSVCDPGPDCRAVLVPANDGDLSAICAYIGVVVLTLQPVPDRWARYDRVSPSLPREDREYLRNLWPEWAPTLRHAVPDYVPDCAAGAPAPVQLTAWKIAAIKIAVILTMRPVTRIDFKTLGIDHRRWLPQEGGWLRLAEDGRGYLAGPRMPDFRAQHPLNFEQIKADADKWMPMLAPVASKQEALI